jgi:hypothetical protein
VNFLREHPHYIVIAGLTIVVVILLFISAP